MRQLKDHLEKNAETISKIILKQFWDYLETTLKKLWDNFETNFERHGDYLVTIHGAYHCPVGSIAPFLYLSSSKSVNFLDKKN